MRVGSNDGSQDVGLLKCQLSQARADQQDLKLDEAKGQQIEKAIDAILKSNRNQITSFESSMASFKGKIADNEALMAEYKSKNTGCIDNDLKAYYDKEIAKLDAGIKKAKDDLEKAADAKKALIEQSDAAQKKFDKQKSDDVLTAQELDEIGNEIKNLEAAIKKEESNLHRADSNLLGVYKGTMSFSTSDPSKNAREVKKGIFR